MPAPEHSGATTPPASPDPRAVTDVQALVERAVRSYSELAAEASPSPSPLPENHDLTQTDVLRLVSALLLAADVEVFELAMWQLWTPK